MIRHPQAIDRYLRWLRDQALPVWSDRGFDRRGGYFQERLDWQGRPLDCPRRSMVQARQIYVFAEAGSLGWFDAGLELAEQAMHSLVRDYATEAHGRIAIRYASAGPLSGMNDSYGHAFVLLAAATLYRAAPSQSLVKLADGVLAHIEDCLVDRQFGGLFDTFPVQGQDKRQNPVMHLVEALLALDLAMPGRGYLERAVTHVRLVKRHLLCPETGAICEYFARNWSIHPDPSKAGLVEPGHLFEWIWLLDQLEQRTSEHEGPTIGAFYSAAARGVMSDARIVDGLRAPSLAIIAPDHRLWPHTEALKAATALSRRRMVHSISAGQYAAVLLEKFCDRPFEGGWVDRVDPSGQAISQDVPASSLYHLMLAGVEAAKTIASVAGSIGEPDARHS